MPKTVTTHQLSGFATCINAECQEHECERSIALIVERVETRADELPVTLSAHEYPRPADDGDYRCPECDQPCAITTEPRRVIPNHLAGLAGTAAAPHGVAGVSSSEQALPIDWQAILEGGEAA